MRAIVSLGLIYIFTMIAYAEVIVELPENYNKLQVPNETIQNVTIEFIEAEPTFIDFRGQKLKIKYWVVNYWQEPRFMVSQTQASDILVIMSY